MKKREMEMNARSEAQVRKEMSGHECSVVWIIAQKITHVCFQALPKEPMKFTRRSDFQNIIHVGEDQTQSWH